MFADITDNDGDRGQVGIGTLIIFIAMVLVAAVAAGVLINTAGLLESTASDTGQDAQSEVSNQISVVSASGTVDTSTGNVTGLNFTVMKSAGSGDIDLADATVEYSTEDVSKTLTFNDDTNPAGSDTFAIANIDNLDSQIDSSTNDIVLSNSSDRVVIQVSPEAIGDQLQEGEEATVRFVDQSGATTVYGVNVPDTISDQDYVAV